ncbi:MAG: DnaJ domain-containing protein [Desulfovibrionaceae bacterium]
MTVQDCYRILGIPPSSTLEEVKSAFRRQAFRLHPDLNPSPTAQQEFQRLNEAYVLLKHTLEQEEKRGGASAAKAGAQAQGSARASAKEGARAYDRQKDRSAGGGQAGPAGKAGGGPGGTGAFFHKKEEVLKDILNDPFARQVFADIYQQVRRDRPGYAPPKQAVQRNLQVNLGSRSLNLDLSQGPLTRIRKWFASQLDDEQTVAFPAHHLLPGRTIRLEISSRFARPRTIEVRLPADFQVGRPIRLRGLGRSLGPFKGDLFLNVTVK